eukprot:2404232-Pyramimonas_sp.AAC.1
MYGQMLTPQAKGKGKGKHQHYGKGNWQPVCQSGSPAIHSKHRHTTHPEQPDDVELNQRSTSASYSTNDQAQELSNQTTTKDQHHQPAMATYTKDMIAEPIQVPHPNDRTT